MLAANSLVGLLRLCIKPGVPTSVLREELVGIDRPGRGSVEVPPPPTAGALSTDPPSPSRVRQARL